jgi:hypothetical protein
MAERNLRLAKEFWRRYTRVRDSIPNYPHELRDMVTFMAGRRDATSVNDLRSALTDEFEGFWDAHGIAHDVFHKYGFRILVLAKDNKTLRDVKRYEGELEEARDYEEIEDHPHYKLGKLFGYPADAIKHLVELDSLPLSKEEKTGLAREIFMAHHAVSYRFHKKKQTQGIRDHVQREARFLEENFPDLKRMCKEELVENLRQKKEAELRGKEAELDKKAAKRKKKEEEHELWFEEFFARHGV